MHTNFRQPYNLNKLNKDLKNKANKTIAICTEPNQSLPVHFINLNSLSDSDYNFFPDKKFQHLGLISHHRLYFYEEVFNSSYAKVLRNKELINCIKKTIAPYKSQIHGGEFYFHGSALVSIILNFLFDRQYDYSNINFLARIQDINSSHPFFFNAIKPNLNNELVEPSFTYIGSQSFSELCFDYIASLANDKVNLTAFLKNQPFNYSQIYYDLEKEELVYTPQFLEFLETSTIKINPELITLNTFLQALRISTLWKIKFFANDYLPFFINIGQASKAGIKQLFFLKENHFKGNINSADSLNTFAFEVKDKNLFYYKKNPIDWLEFKENQTFWIKHSHPAFKHNPAIHPEEYNVFFNQSVATIFERFHLNYTTFPKNFFIHLKDYMTASDYEWEEKDSSFWQNFLFEWRSIAPIKKTYELRTFLNIHTQLKNRFFEMAHYRGIRCTWDFFNKLLNFPKEERQNYPRFIGFLENRLSLLIHNTHQENLFEFAYTDFKNTLLNKEDKFLTIPIFLPWYLKPFVTELISSLDLEKEGRFMNHCVAGYDIKVANHHCRIFHLETGMGHSTLELDPHFNITQHQGYSNHSPRIKNNKLADLLIKFLKKNRIF